MSEDKNIWLTIENGKVTNRTVGKDPHAALSVKEPANATIYICSTTNDGGQSFSAPIACKAFTVLSASAFQDYVWAALGKLKLPNGTKTEQYEAGMGRWTEAFEACKGSSKKAVRAVVQRYEKAQTFERAATAALTLIMVNDDSQDRLTSEERNAIVGENNWPHTLFFE